MKLDGEIILIDRDVFEKDFLKEVLERLKFKVKLVYCPTTTEGFEYLQKTKNEIFLIISEIDFDKMDGLEFKKKINDHPNTAWKSVPFIFIANHVSKEIIDEAYKLDIHGFFQKPAELSELTDLFSTIIRYWSMNLHPNLHEAFYG